MKNIEGFAIALITLPALLGATNTYVKDCKAKFEFTNKWKQGNQQCEIKIKKVAVVGDKGAWDENIWNKKVVYNTVGTTNRRKLNKLTDGHSGSFTVFFDEKCTVGGSWIARTHGAFNMVCKTDKNIKFTIKH